ncbi:hypothetical protein Poli38472_004072 [Pythium oligandrum]|uniref:Telomerase reverse transcriptase n=1 Tax=Pythium oligandrum TaxID=41045 RepID=A0A8K1CMK1_PYTOL|nr:hypothetical protein Poli38472_004072 [Pythium oligandrum]|eukprot:TMW66307.1 hypothetical protein Poli38472_004072 [Pythium oligandrum]
MAMQHGTTLRAFLVSACERAGNADLPGVLRSRLSKDVTWLLKHTTVSQYYMASSEFPKPPWSTSRSLSHNEVIALVIERLLLRKRSDPTDSNLLTLGYREITPGSSGHRIAHSNAVMCYFPNTLVATLKRTPWEELHAVIGDDLMIHLLMNYCVYVEIQGSPGSFMQLAGKSLRWVSHTPTSVPTSNLFQGKKRKRSETSVPSAQVSINQVLYARQFRKRKIFAGQHPLLLQNKSVAPTRGAATRVIHSMFPEFQSEKRLPKRMIKLIPIVQEMLSRFQRLSTKQLTDSVLRDPKPLLEFLRSHPDVRRAIADTKHDIAAIEKPNRATPLDHVAIQALGDGYLSQGESQESHEQRKRVRLDDVIHSLSNTSAASNGQPQRRTAHQRSFHTALRDPALTNTESVSLVRKGIDRLAQLQRHRSEITELVQLTVPKQRVYRIIRKAVAAIVPKELWGVAGEPSGHATTSNWGLVKDFLRRFINSRKYDSLSLKQVATAFRVKSIPWMNPSGQSTCPPNELVKRQDTVMRILHWTVTNIVFPALRNLFYITECEGTSNDVVYFQRSVWNVISSLALYDLTADILKPIPANDALATRQLSVSRLRLLPKVNGVRPLINLSSAAKSGQVAVNASLELVHRALQFEIDRQGERILGATVRNMDEIYAKIQPFFAMVQNCDHCRSRMATIRGSQLVYAVTVDVERCFDTIRPQKLYQMLKKIFLEEEYLVRKHWVFKNAHFKMQRPAYPSGELRSFDELMQSQKGSARDYRAVFVDGVLYDYITKAKILSLLKEHLLGNLVQVNDNVYRQQQGIPQGSVLSTTLCNLYYAHFERRVLRKQAQMDSTVPTTCRHETLMRYTDDFLFISTDVTRARRFAEVMHQGNDDYGCFVNFTKSRANFPVTVINGRGSECLIPRFDQAEEGYHGLLAWCGLRVDTQRLQIYVNYEKLCLSTLAASIPFDETKAARSFFVKKVLSAIRQRWHPLYLDPGLLEPSTIHVNLFQMLSLTAVRFVLLVDMLPVHHSNATSFFHQSIEKILTKTGMDAAQLDWTIAFVVVLTLSSVMTLATLLLSFKDVQLRDSAAQYLAYSLVRSYFVYSMARWVFYVCLLANMNGVQNIIEDVESGQMVGVRIVYTKEQYSSWGKGVIVAVALIGDIALLVNSFCVIGMTYEMKRLIFKSMDRGRDRERQKMRKYDIRLSLAAAFFTTTLVCSALLSPKQEATMRRIAFIFQLVIMWVSVFYPLYSSIQLSCRKRAKSVVDPISLALYQRMKRLVIIYCIFVIPTCTAEMLRRTDWWEVPMLPSGLAQGLYFLSGAGTAFVIGTSATCCFRALQPIMPPTVYEHLLENGYFPEDRVFDPNHLAEPPLYRPIFVCTDIEGSTALWAHDSDAMAEAQSLHDDLLRKELARFDGYEIMTIGDAFEVAFYNVSDAIAWCLSVQEKLLRTEWPENLLKAEKAGKACDTWGRVVFNGLRVRMAVHNGDDQLVHSRHPMTLKIMYMGVSEIVARELSEVGRGGEMLISDSALKIYEQEKTEDSLRDHKVHGTFDHRPMEQLFERADLQISLQVHYIVSKALGDRYKRESMRPELSAARMILMRPH